jgi:maltose alpha-D-glucosyltransferase/alpha-amylase
LFFPKGAPDSGNYDYCYFDSSGQGGIEAFVNNFTRAYDATRDIGYISIPTGNHDIIRHNYGSRNTMDQLKVCMLFHLTMPGVPCIYYGDEIGMKYTTGLNSKEGSGRRAGSRTPMQWSNTWNAGFSLCDPRRLYLPVDTENGSLTVEAQDGDMNSLLNFTRTLLRLRHGHPALGNDGGWQMLSTVGQPYPFIYMREANGKRMVVAINPSAKKVKATIASQHINGRPLIKTGKASYHKGKKGDQITLQGFSAAVFE